MAWPQKRRNIFYLISLALAITGAIYGFNQAHEDRISHDQKQAVLLYDMKILLDNQKALVDNQKVFMKNGTLQDIIDINTEKFAENFSQIYDNKPVNPMTGQP
jgi:hypothetical protein